MRTFLHAAALMLAATPALAEIEIDDAYARGSPGGASGAAFMVLRNPDAADDRLVGVASPLAERVELHTNIEDAAGVMRMRPIEGGIAIPAGGSAALARGGDHVMLMGLAGPLETGDTLPLTLTFESGAEITVDIPVDNARMPGRSGG